MKHMNKRSIVMLGALIAYLPALSLADGEPINQKKDVSVSGHVAVNIPRGEVKLLGWDKPAVQVTGTLDTRAQEFIFDVNGEETLIEVKIDSGRKGWFGSDEGSSLTIYLPASSRMEFNGVSTDVDIQGLEKSVEVSVVSGDVHLVGGPGRVTVQTVSGDLVLTQNTGRVKIGTVSGDIESRSVTGKASYSSVSGDTVVENGGEEIRIESVSGEIEVASGAVNSLSGHSVSGNISIDTGLLDGGLIEFANVSGNIQVRLTGDISARFDLETGSGSIRNSLSKDEAAISRYMGDESLQFTLGDGEGQVILSTRSGDLSVEHHP